MYRIHEDEVRAVCDIPDRYEVVALLPLGHPTGTLGRRPPPPGRLAHQLEHLRQQAPLTHTTSTFGGRPLHGVETDRQNESHGTDWWLSIMSAITARMNSSASSVMPPATPP